MKEISKLISLHSKYNHVEDRVDSMNKVLDQVIEQSIKEKPLSLKSLVSTLLSPRTLPHVLLVCVLCVALHTMVRNDIKEFAAMGFISLGLGYMITALLSSNEFVYRNTCLPETKTNLHKLLRILISFRICIIPLLISALIYLTLTVTLNEDGAGILATILAGLFVVWSVGQARSFRTGVNGWLSAGLAEAKLHSSRPLLSAAIQVTIIQSIAILLIWLATFIEQKQSVSITSALSSGWLFILVSIGVQVLMLWWTREQRARAGEEKGLATFSFKWMVIAQLFVTWHLLSIYRRWWMNPSDIATFIEEAILMFITVLLAIWALTSKSVKKENSVLTERSALPMGISFGYAYAGSVSMLTVTFSDIRGVMMLGHSLTVLTILMLIKPTLLTTMNIQPVPLEESKTKQNKDEEDVDSDSERDNSSEENESEKASIEDESWQEESVDWEQPPAAIDCEVDWDEEEGSDNESDDEKTEILEVIEEDVELIEDDDVELIEDD